MNDEAGWLIEMKFGDGLLWWSGEFDRAGDDYQRARLIARMVNDAGKAVRFARREDAQRVLDGMFSARPCPIFGNAPTLYSVQEHMWPAPSQPGQQPPQPINMVLHCPKCGEQHIDKADAWWNNPPHRSHLCHGCGHIWRPADVPTNGVAAIKTHGTNDSAIAQPPQAEQAAQPVAQEPIHIEAVAEVVLDDDDVPTLRWLVEGGIADLPAGMVLMISDLPLTDDYGSGEVFRASQPQQAPLKERPDFVAGYDAGLADGRRIAEREQAAQPVAWRYREGPNAPRSKMMDGHPGPWTYCEQPDKPYCAWEGVEFEPLFAAAQPQQAISAPAQIDLSNEWPTTRYFVKQVMARFGIGPNENIASALRKLYAEAPAQPLQASPQSSST